MANPVRVVAIPGALRAAANNRKLLALATREAEKHGAQVELLDLKTLALPVYDQDVEDAGMPESVVRAKDAIHRAQGVIISTPEYNASIPGGLKNFVDWVSRPGHIPNPWRDKVVLVMSATGGWGGGRAVQPHLRHSLGVLGAWVLPASMMVPSADDAFDEKGELKDERNRAQLAKLIPLFLAWARQGVPKVEAPK
jgi:chromate reductase, NAD(P)H dehydrogenase (quinone)